ncbi:HPr family phosphocarrier protein [Ferroacidibacillus organovorans]|uniref:Phosphocarrier protein Chr n=1 Tax=Ferroacidibacillus organovorans TaxID=1765683 RepID=A0A162SVF5_9BACL|nr:HPr family phosphocarrier protein [Ferroacidibacillus organovorans]KYP80189.1 phosphocarrier protein Chr [Ferroacidibacillus organovorans]OAG95065.1 phosphocarrier protein Chr [Ferroacidibacillus organovorans]OPG17614.1 phosphocarrier protein Chr [Ferroacidibacillus organovorans]
MAERTVQVNLRAGLQARPAAQFVQEANRFSSDVFLDKDGKSVNAKSIMGVMSLVIPKGATVTLRATGSDAEQAVERLAVLVGSEE